MANPIQFWLSYNNGEDRLQLPVNPEKLTIGGGGYFQDVQVIGLGEYSVIGDPKLNDYSFSSFFPKQYDPNYCEYRDIPEPWAAAALLEKWRDSRRPIRLNITGTPINTPVTIRSFSYDVERGGSPGDLYFDLSLKEYTFLDFKRVATSAADGSSTTVTSEAQRPDTSETPGSYVVKSGDTLTKIAGNPKIFADVSQWRKIYDANKSVIGSNPDLIYPGQTLVIPS